MPFTEVLIGIFQMVNDVEPLFLSNCIFSTLKYMFMSFAIFNYISFFTIEFLELFIYSRYKTIVSYVANEYFLPVSSFFQSLQMVFGRVKISILIGPIYLFLLFIIFFTDMLNSTMVVLDVSCLFYLFFLYVSRFDANCKN